MPTSTRSPAAARAEQSVAQLQRRVAELETQLERLREREAAWRREQVDLRDFVENAAVGLHKVGPDGTILWANAADCQLVGYAADEYIGHNISEFHADQEALRYILGCLVGGQTLRDHPAVLRCKDGSLRHVLISSNGHFEDGKFVNTRCFTRDVTEHRNAQARLHETQQRLAAIVDSSEDAIVGITLDGVVTSWNRAAARLYGYEPHEIIGKPVTTFIPPELHAEEHEFIARVRRGEKVEHYETARLRRDGTRLDISISISPVHDTNGRLIGISKVGRDITESKAARRELAEAARRKDEFLAILAHELRNPLAPIRYALSIASHPGQSAEQRRRAEEVIARQVEQMARLLDDLLDVSRIARGHVELRRKRSDLTSIIGAAIDAARPLLDAKGHVLGLELPSEALRLEVDPVRITQILANLLTNAAKYTDRGGSIRLRAWREGGDVCLSVRDNGIGISEEMKPRLFTLFSQATAARQRSEGGLGVGLALVKGFAEMHGGSVEARSDGPGKGSEFVVRLPVGGAHAEERTAASAPAAANATLRILVADDNTDSADTCAMLLRAWGYDVARAIRAEPWGAETTLIAVTGWGQEEDRRNTAAAGFDHHLTKPVDPQQLQALLERRG